jgi:hypothetical protein
MSIGCRNGGVSHTHDTVDEVRQCHGISPDAPIKNVVPNGPKPGNPDKAKEIETKRREEESNTALARKGKDHGFTSNCPECVGIGVGHAVASRPFTAPHVVGDMHMKAEYAEQERQQEEAAYRAKMERGREWVAEDEEFSNALRDASEGRAREALAFQTSKSERTTFLNAESSERPRWNGFSHRPNKYGGTCTECDHWVKPEEGLLGPKVAGKFTVLHKDGECQRQSEVKEMVAASNPHTPLPSVPAGYYAIQSMTGHNDLDFFRVDRPDSYTQGHAAENWIGEWKGRTFIKRVIGGKPDRNIRRSQYLDVLNAILKMGVGASGALYAEKIGACKHCNRSLTDELSRQRASGPDCFDRYGN